jgi:hypothetical protein
MDDYLTKPVSGQALAAMLDPWLPKQALPEQPAMEVTTCASTPGPEALVFDHAKLLERMVGDVALARMFGVGFLQDIPQRIAVLRGFLEVGDPPVPNARPTPSRARPPTSGPTLCVRWLQTWNGRRRLAIWTRSSPSCRNYKLSSRIFRKDTSQVTHP